MTNTVPTAALDEFPIPEAVQKPQQQKQTIDPYNVRHMPKLHTPSAHTPFLTPVYALGLWRSW